MNGENKMKNINKKLEIQNERILKQIHVTYFNINCYCDNNMIRKSIEEFIMEYQKKTLLFCMEQLHLRKKEKERITS